MGKEVIQHPVLKWVFPVLALSLVACVYLVFVYINLVPQFEHLQSLTQPTLLDSIDQTDPHLHKASVAEVVGVTTAFHVLFFMFLLSFFRSIITPPGSIPESPRWTMGAFTNIHPEDEKKIKELIRAEKVNLHQSTLQRFLHLFPLVERKRDSRAGDEKLGDKRRCKYCLWKKGGKSGKSGKSGKGEKMYKPDRCHHCSICNTCVLRMDHHCPWIANCVGFHNYKFFLLLLMYCLSCLGMILGALAPRLVNVFQPILDVKYFLSRDMVVVVIYVVSLFFFITLAMFFGFHLWLVLNSMTTIEYREKSQVRQRFRVSHTKYNYGWYLNILHVFGPPYMWLLPISPPPLNFLNMQRNFLRQRIITGPRDADDDVEIRGQREEELEQAEWERACLLADALSTPTAEADAIREVGCYYTPLPENYRLWALKEGDAADIETADKAYADTGERRHLVAEVDSDPVHNLSQSLPAPQDTDVDQEAEHDHSEADGLDHEDEEHDLPQKAS